MRGCKDDCLIEFSDASCMMLKGDEQRPLTISTRYAVTWRYAMSSVYNYI